MTPICKNCDHPLEPSFAFCPSCGQKTITRRLQLAEVLHDFWAQITDIDKGFFTLLRDLVVRPGIVAQEYIAGKRRKHFGPLNFYLIVGTILILSMNLTEWIHADRHEASNKNTDGMPAVQSPATDSLRGTSGPKSPQVEASASAKTQSINAPASGASKIQERRKAVGHFWTQYSDFVSIAAAPFLCVFFWLFYRRAGFNYTELLVACLYMMGFTNLVYALVASPLTSLLSSSRQTSFAMTGVFKMFEIGYFTFFYNQLTQGTVRRPLLRAALSSLLVAVFWTALTYLLVGIYIMTGFGLD